MRWAMSKGFGFAGKIAVILLAVRIGEDDPVGDPAESPWAHFGRKRHGASCQVMVSVSRARVAATKSSERALRCSRA